MPVPDKYEGFVGRNTIYSDGEATRVVWFPSAGDEREASVGISEKVLQAAGVDLSDEADPLVVARLDLDSDLPLNPLDLERNGNLPKLGEDFTAIQPGH
jgi:hypothetical protein